MTESWGPGTNTGHGHIWDRPDKRVNRCGSTLLCPTCRADANRLDAQMPDLDRVCNTALSWAEEYGFCDPVQAAAVVGAVTRLCPHLTAGTPHDLTASPAPVNPR